MMSAQVVPSALAQCNISKVLTNKNRKSVEVLKIFSIKFDGETLSRIQVYE
jgi:hypothetical protein